MEQLVNEGEKYIMHTYGRFPLVLEHGEGVYLYDEKGKKYLDMYAGIAVNALGYAHPTLTAALQEQVEKMMHVSNYYYTKNLIEASKLLVENSPFDKVFFCNSGAEANEGALKLAKKYGKLKSEDKVQIIAMKKSFHGRTHGALAVTGQEKYQKSFMPLIPNVSYADYNDIDSLKAIMSDKTCAVILEVIQGEGGIIPGDPAYLQAVEALCKAHDALLIVDEVQTGIGRTGTLFAFEQFGIHPDIVTMAKGLGAGVPIGAMACTSKADVLVPGDHASTFGGNPLVTAAAKVVLKELTVNHLLDHVKEVGAYLKGELLKLQKEFDCIKEVRGFGMMLGMELTLPALEVEKKCMDKGMLVVGAGEKVVRFVPPLIIEKAHVDEAIAILKSVLSEM
ncbi:acetylornithine transaminase [Cellulosilyticum sp. ST5]|uniref:acetylornithine transaminase n=1 Tax=unclassified Cellulosilyticum TaxID=2643091 RepID=UPI000F8E91A4|nr:acetylornithine transaminase [Cellulosilyticum sp. WCF-2]QEH68603.1 acetylornithine transaminase [Cellulosilyticum sp. WCF-2]